MNARPERRETQPSDDKQSVTARGTLMFNAVLLRCLCLDQNESGEENARMPSLSACLHLGPRNLQAALLSEHHLPCSQSITGNGVWRC